VKGVIGVARRLDGMNHASAAAWRVLEEALPLRQTRGRISDWDTDPDTGQNSCTRLKAVLSHLDQQARAELAEVRRWCLMPLVRAVRQFVLRYAAQRKRQGLAEFHDLLVWARDLLRDNLEVWDYFQEKYENILLDETQDTDPIQAEIAIFLAEDVPRGTPPESRPRQWTEINPTPGKLFVVGDPKQSIYRFRTPTWRSWPAFRVLLPRSRCTWCRTFAPSGPWSTG
jgi:ATP-dependent helicase/nuclease subunit A